MAINYPTSLDTLTNFPTDDKLAAPDISLKQKLNDLQDAVEALQAKVGVNSSSVGTSLDKRVDTLENATPSGVTDDVVLLTQIFS